MSDQELATSPAFRKSSYSADNLCCVEVAVASDRVLIRDSKVARSPFASPILTFNPDEWRAFVAGVKAGEFDHTME